MFYVTVLIVAWVDSVVSTFRLSLLNSYTYLTFFAEPEPSRRGTRSESVDSSWSELRRSRSVYRMQYAYATCDINLFNDSQRLARSSHGSDVDVSSPPTTPIAVETSRSNQAARSRLALERAQSFSVFDRWRSSWVPKFKKKR